MCISASALSTLKAVIEVKSERLRRGEEEGNRGTGEQQVEASVRGRDEGSLPFETPAMLRHGCFRYFPRIDGANQGVADTHPRVVTLTYD